MASFAPWRQRLCCRPLNRCDLASQAPAGLNRSARLSDIFFFCFFLLHRRQRDISQPSIEFTQIPVADTGGPDKMDTIEGRATGVRAGQQIVLYAKSDGGWWIQRFAREPFTKIRGDSNWTRPGFS